MPAFLVPERIADEDGQGANVALPQPCSERLQVTLGITRIRERESLSVSIWGSPDGQQWKPLAAFPRKSFCGTYALVLNLSHHRDLQYIRTQWKMHRWSGQESKPLFSFYVWAEEYRLKALRAAS